MRRVRKDDRVEVVTGKDRGRTGRVVKVLPDQQRVMVEGVGYVTQHQPLRGTPGGGQQGGIIETESPIHLSNVMPVCPSCEEAVRVSYVYADEDDRRSKTRQCKNCQANF